MTNHNWRFLAELLRQLDEGVEATGRTVADALTLDKEVATTQLRALRRRGLVEERPGPSRLGDGSLDAKLEMTPEGVRAAASGQID